MTQPQRDYLVTIVKKIRRFHQSIETDDVPTADDCERVARTIEDVMETDSGQMAHLVIDTWRKKTERGVMDLFRPRNNQQVTQ